MTPPSSRIDQSERALKTLSLVMLGASLAIVIYAGQSKTWAYFLTSLATGILVAAAASLGGGLLGFLFGIPRTAQPTVAVSTSLALATPGSAGSVGAQQYQPNTNLEQISDWLTKILVGVGLIQVRAIVEKLYGVAGGIASALSDTRPNRSFALALIVFYSVSGFLLVYLWTRLYLPGAFRRADALDDKIQSLETKLVQVDQRSRDAQATSLGTGKGESEDVVKKLLGTTENPAPTNSDDPWKGLFGGASTNNDRQMQAEVNPISGSSGLYAIRLTVKSSHPETNPLKGAVQFFLHPTFRDAKPVITVGQNGIAELNLKAWGAFTVGAIADDGQTKLEVDLSQIETAPEEFRSR
jgi:hypothetical protein